MKDLFLKKSEKESFKSNTLDMLNGSIPKNMILFSLPLAATNILQQLFNSADVAVAGRFAGSEALAAVGANAPIVSLFVSILGGLALGANVLIARYIGEGQKERISGTIHTAMLFSIISGIAMLAFGIIFARPLLEAISTPENVLNDAVLYLTIYSLGLPFLMFYNYGSAVLRSIGDTKRPMYVLIFSGILNVFLNLFFVIVCNMSTSGVAVATIISEILSAFIIMRILSKEAYPFQLKMSALKLQKAPLSTMLQIGAPAAIQSSLFCISNIIVQAGINSFGADATAGSSAGLNFEYITYYIINAYAQAVVTFVSQNYGARNKKRCINSLKFGMIEGMGLTAVVSFLLVLSVNFTILFFTTDKAVIVYAIARISIVTALEAFTGLYEITGAAIRGLGNSLLPAVITVIGTVIFRVFWVQVIFVQDHTFETLMMLYPVSWLITGAVMIPACIITIRKTLKAFDN